MSGLGQWTKAFLERPSKEDVGDILVILLCDVLENWIFELASDQRAIRLDDYAILFAVFHYWLLLAERMELNLVDRGGLKTCFANFLEMLYVVVRKTNGLEQRLWLSRVPSTSRDVSSSLKWDYG